MRSVIECIVMYDIGKNKRALDVLCDKKSGDSEQKDKRREKVQQIILEFDGIYIQNSVYICFLSAKRLTELMNLIEKELNENDSVYLFFARKKDKFEYIKL